MLGMFAKKTDHPLADLAEARRIAAEIARMEPKAGVAEATVWLESLLHAEGYKLNALAERLLMIENAGASQAGRVVRDFIHLPKESPAARALWPLAARFWTQLAHALEACCDRYLEGGRSNALRREEAALLFAAALHARASMRKWLQFHYRQPGAEFWKKAGDRYQTAARLDLHLRAEELHPGHGTTTVEGEYLRLLLFQVAAMDTLAPREIELGERLIALFLDRFTLARDVRPENVYWVDLASGRPPARLARLPQITPTLFFFNGSHALEGLDALERRIDAAGMVPGDVNLGGQYPVESVRKVIAHLRRCWASKPPMRSHVRRAIATPVALVPGLDQVIQTLAYAMATSRTKVGPLEVWSVTDISMGGMALEGTPGKSDWPAVGALVALLPDGGSTWLVGVARRVGRREDEPEDGVESQVTELGGTRLTTLGIETLSKQAWAVSADAEGLPVDIVVLDQPVRGGNVRILIQPNAYEAGIALRLSLQDQPMRLQPLDLVDAGPDYVMVNCFVREFGTDLT